MLPSKLPASLKYDDTASAPVADIIENVIKDIEQALSSPNVPDTNEPAPRNDSTSVSENVIKDIEQALSSSNVPDANGTVSRNDSTSADKARGDLLATPIIIAGGIAAVAILAAIFIRRKSKPNPKPAASTPALGGPFCSSCGSPVATGAAFCVSCGSPVNKNPQ